MRNNSKLKIIILITIAIIALTIGGGFFYINSKLNKVEKVEINKDNLSIDQSIENDKEKSKIKNIALFGIDAPQGKVGRSDSVMVLTIDEKNKKLKLTSIMRDSYVNIPGHGDDKLTHAYAFGGPELAIKTLNENYKLNIKDFMAVNFTSMPEIIDKLGGVEIDITKEEISHISGVTHPGKQNLNGEEALAYSRIRHATGGDYQRTNRQRTVLDAIFNKVKNISITEIPGFIDSFLPYVKTNMSSSELIGLATDVIPLMSNGLESARFPLNGYCEGKIINKVWYLVFDRKTTLKQIQDYIYENKALPEHSNDNT
ncbi:LCP family protein [Clostridium chrysemydis]|uniref:LCP family protein n=1 Tax=Clostridium chrysemydis TaxID=2665504 RepID=UPI0018839077|nr:LCP family protein [Clostridium chrysemydis]